MATPIYTIERTTDDDGLWMIIALAGSPLNDHTLEAFTRLCTQSWVIKSKCKRLAESKRIKLLIDPSYGVFPIESARGILGNLHRKVKIERAKTVTIKRSMEADGEPHTHVAASTIATPAPQHNYRFSFVLQWPGFSSILSIRLRKG